MAVVLVADDEAHVRWVLSHKLKQAGHEVLLAADGQEALELALQRRPELMITDLQMPGLGGLELCRRLAADPATSNIPVVMLTGRGHAPGDEELRDTRIRKVFSKPFSPAEVMKAVAELTSQAT